MKRSDGPRLNCTAVVKAEVMTQNLEAVVIPDQTFGGV